MALLQGRALFVAVTTLTCLGFLLIGFDNGLMGGVVNTPSFKYTFNSPSSSMIGTIVAIYEIGCFIGSLMTSVVGENLGRRKSVFIGVIVMIIGAVLQGAAVNRAMMIFARVVAGIGMGWINSTVPVMQSEFSPKAARGLYVCMQVTTLNLGIMLSYWVDYAFSLSSTASAATSYTWRVPCFLQLFFLVPMIPILMVIPESPRWLATHADPDVSLAVLTRLHHHDMSVGQIADLHSSIIATADHEKSLGTGSWGDLFRDDEIKSRRRFLIACGIQSFQQLGGINAIIYYSSTLFSSSLKFSDHLSALMSGFLQTWLFVGSFIPWLLIDRLGRRPLFLSMISVMAIVMAAQTGFIYNVQYKTPSATACGYAAAVMLFLFEGAFTIGFQATVWVYPSEILPLRLRQRGSSISTACNWIFNYIIVQITPIAIDSIGYKTYIIFAVLNAAWLVPIYFFFPETKGLELENVDNLFQYLGNATVGRDGRGGWTGSALEVEMGPSRKSKDEEGGVTTSSHHFESKR